MRTIAETNAWCQWLSSLPRGNTVEPLVSEGDKLRHRYPRAPSRCGNPSVVWWYARCYLCLPGGSGERGIPVGGWKKFIVISLIAAQLTSATYTGPERVPATDPANPSFWDIVVQQAGSLLELGGADKFVIMALSVAVTLQTGKVTGVLWNIPAARTLRKETLEKLENMRREYEKHRDLYVKFPEDIQKLERENSALREELTKAEKAKDFTKAEELRRHIDRNQASIDAKRLKVPVIMMAEAIRSLGEAESGFDKHVQELRGAVAAAARTAQPAVAARGNGRTRNNGSNGNGHAASNGAGNGTPKGPSANSVQTAATAIDRWNQTRRQDYISEWLESRHGREFAQGAGRDWANEYQQLLSDMNGKVERLATIYNGMVDNYNHHLTPDRMLPRLEPQRSAYGPSLRYFSLEPENPHDVSREIEVGQIGKSLMEVCDKKLSLLKTSVKDLAKKASFRTAYAAQIGHVAALSVTGGGLFGVYAWYQYKQGKPFQQVQKEEATQNRIQQNTDVTLAAQFEKEKKGENRLRPFLEASTWSFENSQTALEQALADSFNMRDREAKKPELLRQRQREASQLGAEAERLRVSQALERATWEFYTKLNITSFEQVRQSLYNEDQGVRDTILRRDMTLIYRDTLLKLYPNIIDDDALNLLEPTVIRKMVDDTLTTLTQKLDELKRKGNPAPAKSDPNIAPLPGTTPPAVSLPASAQQSSATELPNATKMLVGSPGLPPMPKP